MKYCSHCGAEIEDNAVVCPQCGAPVNEIPESEKIKNESSTLGILSIVFGALGGWLGLLFGIIGLCTYKKKENKQKCIIGMCLFAAWIVILIVIAAAAS